MDTVTASSPSLRDPELDAIAASLRQRFDFDGIIILARRKVEDRCGDDDGSLIGPVIAISGDVSVWHWHKLLKSLLSIFDALNDAHVANDYGLEEPKGLFQNRIFHGLCKLFGDVGTEKSFNEYRRQHNALTEALLSTSQFAEEYDLLPGLGDNCLNDDGETSFPS